VNELVEKGHRLPKLDNIPDDVYKLMLDCWHIRDRHRPNFQFLAKFFKQQLLKDENAQNDNNAEPTALDDDNISDFDESLDKHTNTVYV
jgi:hypothetical protein